MAVGAHDRVDEHDAQLYGRLGAEIARARQQHGMSQTDLGGAIGRSQRQVSAYESGESATPIHVVTAIERALRLTGGSLLIGAGIVDEVVDGLDAIRSDPRLDELDRGNLVYLYERSLSRSAPAANDADMSAKKRSSKS